MLITLRILSYEQRVEHAVTKMELTLDQALQKGIEAHKAGQVQDADRYYTAILKANPKHPDANHNMGVLAVDVSKVQEALPFFKTALEVNPSIAQYWLSYINALIKLDRITDAKAVLEQAKSNGINVDGFDQLEIRLASLTSQNPDAQEPPTDQLQGLVGLYTKGQYQEALDKGSQLLKQFPSSVNLHNIIGAANKGLGKLEDAVEAYTKALALKPDYADAYYNMGNALKEQGKLDKAIKAYTKALALKPDYAEAYYNMGNALKDQRKLEEAIEAYNKAISLKPDYAKAFSNMGITLQDQGKLEEAIQAYNKALAIEPNSADAYNNMGSALQEQGKIDEAIEAHEKAISIKPDYADAYWNLSGTANEVSASKKWVEKCLKADPKHLRAKLTLSALKFYESDKSNFNEVIKSSLNDHPSTRSFSWAFSLPQLPQLHFHRWALFDQMIDLSKKDRPFYEFGVWRAEAFKYLIKTFKKGYGFDTFEGLPEAWHNNKVGTYSSDGNIPKIKGGEFIVGKFEDTLPGFFAEDRPMASIINFDADLYSSTICALNFAKPVIDQDTILIFDEFIMNKNWEQDEYRALEEFCSNNDYTYKVLAISFFTKQVAVKLIGI